MNIGTDDRNGGIARIPGQPQHPHSFVALQGYYDGCETKFQVHLVGGPNQ